MKKATAILFFVLLIVLNLSIKAQSDFGLKGIGAKLGYVSPEDPIESTIGFGAVVNLGQIIPAIKLDAGIDYWSKTYDSGSIYGTTWESTISAITIYGLGKYYIPVGNTPVKPYGGVGLGFVISKVSVDVPGFSTSESDTDFGFRLVGGADYQISPNIKGFAEINYHSNGTDFLGIFAGVVYILGK
ncbi:outer membrane beta-barrel protein [Rosettibacter firmus]|uniref:outer membrane beta-barrel protein n=1 Tax=Rosettibacter firmus TaxID=3111522 RepID=UPI00336BCAA6